MDAEEKGPAPDAADHGPNANNLRSNGNDGQAGKQLAFDLHRQHRAELIARACRIMAQAASEKGAVTIEDVRARMEIPKDLNPVWLGVVPTILARKGIIAKDGYTTAQRPKAHARPIAIWRLVREPAPGELDDICSPPPRRRRPDRPQDGEPPAQARAKPDRPVPRPAGASATPLFPQMRRNWTDGDAGLDRAGRRRR